MPPSSVPEKPATKIDPTLAFAVERGQDARPLARPILAPSGIDSEAERTATARDFGQRSASDRTNELSPRERKQARRLVTVLIIVSVFFAFELVGAMIAQSDVLKAEALHLLMDVAVLGTAIVAMRLAVRRPTVRFTYGLRRIEPFAAFINGLLVLAASAHIVHEGIENLENGASPRADVMLFVASAAFVVNGISAWLIHGALDERQGAHEHHGHAHAHGHALNLRGALLHLVGDALGSLAALVAALLIRFGVSPKVDPIASFVVAAILVIAALRLLKDAILVLLEAAPTHLSVDQVRTRVLATPGVLELHDLHVWSLGGGHDAITVHVRGEAGERGLGGRIERGLRDAFGIEYVTVQVEEAGEVCEAPRDES